jgi:hypothetical protein
MVAIAERKLLVFVFDFIVDESFSSSEVNQLIPVSFRIPKSSSDLKKEYCKS